MQIKLGHLSEEAKAEFINHKHFNKFDADYIGELLIQGEDMVIADIDPDDVEEYVGKKLYGNDSEN